MAGLRTMAEATLIEVVNQGRIEKKPKIILENCLPYHF